MYLVCSRLFTEQLANLHRQSSRNFSSRSKETFFNMKFAGVFFMAFLALLAVQTKSEECLKDGEDLLDGTTVDCIALYGRAVDKVSMDMYCCSQADYTAKIDSGYDKGTPYFTCECEG
ncbi:hypothetical protein PoB_004946400 [Plakobranchus ocellatus]|uniref:Plethodontid modulating factor n=1 Tax=Plakobranchus ocellatus TaxID=259542 RepID=A0AAV4BVX7_9GAST|nr:hypothetical protein PoB_004946400 [Plakobranchus ocellatus]